MTQTPTSTPTTTPIVPLELTRSPVTNGLKGLILPCPFVT